MFFSNLANTASVIPISKKKDQINIENYRAVCILNCFFKIYERSFYDQLTVNMDEILSDFMAAYRRGYSTSHVLMRLIENWRKAFDNSLFK